MSGHDPQDRESHLLLSLLALFLFASPLTIWWSTAVRSWYLPYLLWLLIILIGGWLQYRRRHHDL